MSFSQFQLDSRLQQGVESMGFVQPTPIQTATIPIAMEGRDLLGSAETGTGKTAAFMLPALQDTLGQKLGKHIVRTLVLVPTRELALQLADQGAQLSQHTPLRVGAVFGGVGLGPQENMLRRGVDALVATPGRLLDHMALGNVRFSSLQVLVLDEADRMLDIGFLPDLRRIVRQLPRKRQTMLFSATLPPAIMRLATEVTQDPARIQVETSIAPQEIAQTVFPVPELQKVEALRELLKEEEMSSVLVFARTKRRADRLAAQLQRCNIRAAVIHGDRSQGQRIAALEGFRAGRSRVLVATDIAARGIDVEGISHVVNYDVPMQPEDYVHRIGRTGRAHAVGNAYTLMSYLDEEMVYKIETVLQHRIERRHLEGIGYEPVERSHRKPALAFGSIRRRSRTGSRRRCTHIA